MKGAAALEYRAHQLGHDTRYRQVQRENQVVLTPLADKLRQRLNKIP